MISERIVGPPASPYPALLLFRLKSSRGPPPPPAHSPLAPIYLEKVSMLSPSLPSFSAGEEEGGGESDFSTGGVGGGKDRECDLSLSPSPLRNPHKIRGGSSAHTLPLYGRESEGPPGGSFSSGRFLCPHSPPPLFLSSLAAQSRGGIWVGKRRGGGEGNHGFGFHAATLLHTYTTTYLPFCRESEALEYYVVYKH